MNRPFLILLAVIVLGALVWLGLSFAPLSATYPDETVHKDSPEQVTTGPVDESKHVGGEKASVAFDETRFITAEPTKPAQVNTYDGASDGGCSRAYYLQGGKVYWGIVGHCGEQGTNGVEAVGADVDTFVILASNYDRYAYARDKNHVYFGGEVVPGDPATFRIVNWSGFVLDKNTVYPYGKKEAIVGADPATFENVADNQLIYRDKARVYCSVHDGPYVLSGADPKTIEPVLSTYGSSNSVPYAKDAARVYDLWKCAVVAGADPKDYPTMDPNAG